MEYKCPQCGKIIVRSHDELVSQGHLVVCPQCLSEFEVAPTAPEVGSHGAGTYGYGQPTAEAPSQSAAHQSYAIFACTVCGNQVQSNFNYCPFCGRRIGAQQYHPSPAVRRQPATAVQTQEAPRQGQQGQQGQQSPRMPYVPHYRYGYKTTAPGRKLGSKPWFWTYIVVLIVLAILLLRSIF